MKKSSYWLGAIAIIVVIVVASMVARKPAATPVVPTTGSSSTAPAASAPTASAPATSSGSIVIHVKKGGLAVWYSAPTTTVASEIHIDNPPADTTATSPMSVSGQARGSWFFEGTMPIFLTDAKGRILAQSTVRAQSDWMTDGPVPFLGKLTFPRQPTGSTGAFVIRNDNPSGMAANQKQVEILVTFN